MVTVTIRLSEDSRYYQVSAHLTDLPAKSIPKLFNVLFRQYADLSLLRYHVAVFASKGILTFHPSIFAFAYILGPD